MTKFGEIIKTERLKQRMLSRDFAAKLGITTVQLHNVESGKNLPRVNKIEMYANALNLDVDELTKVWLEDNGIK